MRVENDDLVPSYYVRMYIVQVAPTHGTDRDNWRRFLTHWPQQLLYHGTIERERERERENISGPTGNCNATNFNKM